MEQKTIVMNLNATELQVMRKFLGNVEWSKYRVVK